MGEENTKNELKAAHKIGVLKVLARREAIISPVSNSFGSIRFKEFDHLTRKLKLGIRLAVLEALARDRKLWGIKEDEESLVQNLKSSDIVGHVTSFEELINNEEAMLAVGKQNLKFPAQKLVAKLNSCVIREGVNFDIHEVFFIDEFKTSVLQIEICLSSQCITYFPPLYDFESEIKVIATVYDGMVTTQDIFNT